MTDIQATYRRFFRAALTQVTEWRAAYDAEVADWYEHGDGRSPEWVNYPDDSEDDPYGHRVNVGGKGYRFPRCIHGMSLWTDYDNICGGCEDSVTTLQEAQRLAQANFYTWQQRSDWFKSAPAGFSTAAGDAYGSIVVWVFETFPQA